MAALHELLRTYRAASHLSQRALAQASGVNQAIISRLENGDRDPSGPEQVMAIATALRLDDRQMSTLLSSAGYWPHVYLALGPSDSTLLAVAQTLCDQGLSERKKAGFRRLVESLAQEWAEP